MTLDSNQSQGIRNNADAEFNNVYKKCIKIAKVKGNTLETPRKSSRQVHRLNVESNTPEEYWYRTIFDSVFEQLNERFNGKSKASMKGKDECNVFIFWFSR